jgi:uncharacterized protein with beta-barrel porin domain
VQHAAGSRSVFRNADWFTILTAGGTLADQGAVVTCNSSFLTFIGATYGKNYTVTAQRTASFVSAVGGGNDHSVAAALDADGEAAVNDFAVLVNELLFMNATEFATAVPHLSPAPYHDVNIATNRTTQYLAEGLADYLHARRAGGAGPDMTAATLSRGTPLAAAAAAGPIHFVSNVEQAADSEVRREMCGDERFAFADPFGVFFGEKSTADRVGFQASVVGTQFGVDKHVSECCILGVGGAYANTRVDFNDSYGAGDVNTFRVGPYLTAFGEHWFVDANLTGGFHANDVRRNASAGAIAATAKGDYHANDLAAYLGSGLDYDMAWCTLAPTASLQYIYYRQDGFNESGAGGADLAVAPKDANSLRSLLGARLTRVFSCGEKKIIPELFGGWAHEYLATDDLDARFVAGTTTFSITPGTVFRDSAYFGGGVSAMPRERVLLFARYKGEQSSGSHFHGCDLGLAISF